jgi:hypothetical protein
LISSELTTETLLILSSAGRSGWRPLNSTYTEGYLYKIYRDSETTMLNIPQSEYGFATLIKISVIILLTFADLRFSELCSPKNVELKTVYLFSSKSNSKPAIEV